MKKQIENKSDMANIKIVLKNKKKDGTYNIQFDITQSQRHAYISTEYYVMPNQFKNGKVQKHDNATIFNNRLREKLTEYERKLDDIAVSIERMTALEIKNYLTTEKTTFQPKLFASIKKRMDELEHEYERKKEHGEKASNKTYMAYQTLRNSLFSFITSKQGAQSPESEFEKADIYLETVDINFLKKYVDYLSEKGNTSSKWNYLKDLRAIFNNEINEGNLSPEYYPFKRYNINRHKKQIEPRVLSVAELKKIISTPAQNPEEEFARKTFILDFMLLGINSTDLYNFGINGTEIVDDRYNFDRSKTDVINSIKIEPEAQEIIKELAGKEKPLFFQEKYNNHENFYRSTNKFLKRYADSIGMPEFTLGYARYTWATIAYNNLDIDESTIDVALGHKTSKTVAGAHYIKKARTKVDEANRKMIDYLLS